MTEVKTTKLPESCQTTLEETDFEKYDHVPDGVIYLDEWTEEELQCFVQSYLHTSNKDSREFFVGSMSNSTIEAVRNKLIQMHDNGEIDDSLAKRYNYIMEKELSQDTWTLSGNADFSVQKDSYKLNSNESGNTSDSSLYFTSKANATALRLDIFDVSKLITSLSAGGAYNYGGKDDNATVDNISTAGVNTIGSLNHLARDNSWEYGAIGVYDRFFSVAPDQLVQHYGVSAWGQIREIGDTNLALEGSFNLGETSYALPYYENFNRKHENKMGGDLSTTYHVKPWDMGLVLLVEGESGNETDHESTLLSQDLSASLLIQKEFLESIYFKFGGSTNVHSLGYDFAEREEESNSTGYGLNAIASLIWTLNDSFDLSTKVLFQENKDTGTFVSNGNLEDFKGWYPSWELTLAANLSLIADLLFLSAEVEHTGNDIDLEMVQRNRDTSTTISVELTPTDDLSISFESNLSFGNTRIYATSESLTLGAKAEISYSLTDEWGVRGTVEYGNHQTNSPEYSYQEDSLIAQISTSLKF
ncbi:MAG: hypothetical protein HQM16_18095 [Deltaproteobacteria bacterium]|nr:hypothetical protein [Deltaproteobacteria bacterium]